MKYDDLTLMKFADGELEIDLAKEIENEILVDEELKARLEIFTSTTANKIRRAQEYGRMLRHKNLNKPISKMGEVAAFAKSERSTLDSDLDVAMKKKFETIRSEAFDKTEQSDEIPSHIIDLIENFEPPLKEIAISKINERKRKFKIRIGVISSIFAAVIAFSLMPQVATKGINFFDNSGASISILNISEERLV